MTKHSPQSDGLPWFPLFSRDYVAFSSLHVFQCSMAEVFLTKMSLKSDSDKIKHSNIKLLRNY